MSIYCTQREGEREREREGQNIDLRADSCLGQAAVSEVAASAANLQRPRSFWGDDQTLGWRDVFGYFWVMFFCEFDDDDDDEWWFPNIFQIWKVWEWHSSHVQSETGFQLHRLIGAHHVCWVSTLLSLCPHSLPKPSMSLQPTKQCLPL